MLLLQDNVPATSQLLLLLRHQTPTRDEPLAPLIIA